MTDQAVAELQKAVTLSGEQVPDVHRQPRARVRGSRQETRSRKAPRRVEEALQLGPVVHAGDRRRLHRARRLGSGDGVAREGLRRTVQPRHPDWAGIRSAPLGSALSGSRAARSAASIAPTVVYFNRGRPQFLPFASSSASSARQSEYVTASGCRARTSASAAPGSGCSGSPTAPRATSSIIAVTVSTASGLLVPMTPLGPRLIQPATYKPGTGRDVAGSITRPFSFGITPQRSWNGTPGSGTPRYTHRPKHEPHVEILELAGRLRGDLPLVVRDERVAHQPQLCDVARGVANDFDGRDQEPHVQAPGAALGLSDGIALQDLDLPYKLAIVARVELGLAERIQRHLVGPHDHVRVGHLADFLDLGVGERRLCRAAAAEQEHLPDTALAQGIERVIGDVGGFELFGRAHEHACDVDGDVADAHDRSALHGQIELARTVVRVPVVPGDEFCRWMASREVFARNAHAPVGLRAGGEHNLVIVPAQIVQREVTAQLDVAEETESRVGGGRVVGAGDGLDLGWSGATP